MRRSRTSLGTEKSSGFSLIELLLVVAIIAIIVSVAIPSLMDSRMAANETTAISYLRTWVSAQEIYHLKYGVYADADGQLFDEGLIGSKPAADSHGYTFTVDNPPGSQYVWWGGGGTGHSGTDRNAVFFRRSVRCDSLFDVQSRHRQLNPSRGFLVAGFPAGKAPADFCVPFLPYLPIPKVEPVPSKTGEFQPQAFAQQAAECLLGDSGDSDRLGE